MLDQPLLVPVCELFVGQVGNPAAYRCLGSGFVEAEIQFDAAHALVLEVGRCGHAVCGERRIDIPEATAVDQIDQLRFLFTIDGTALIRGRCRPRPQQQRGTKAGSGRQRRFANGRIHSDTSQARVVTAV
ncbi:hypothetical protein D3C73_822640 [compost metagenome]